MSTNFQISLNIPDVEILKIEKNKTEDLIITVKSTKCSTPCHQCGKEAKKSNGYGETIILQHLPIFGQQVYIRIKLQDIDVKIAMTNRQPQSKHPGLIGAVNLQRHMKNI